MCHKILSIFLPLRKCENHSQLRIKKKVASHSQPLLYKNIQDCHLCYYTQN